MFESSVVVDGQTIKISKCALLQLPRLLPLPPPTFCLSACFPASLSSHPSPLLLPLPTASHTHPPPPRRELPARTYLRTATLSADLKEYLDADV